MWIRVVLLILILSAVALCACASGSRTSEDKPEETITIGFVNSIKTADVWIIPDTEENRKTSIMNQNP